jgi:hypothetical protein
VFSNIYGNVPLPEVPKYSKAPPKKPTEEEKAIARFLKVNEYYAQHRKEPTMNRSNPLEYEMCMLLQLTRHTQSKYPSIHAYDKFKLLANGRQSRI